MTVKYGKLYAKDSSGNVVQIIPESQTIEEYQGATSNAAGLPGLVPGALSSEKDKYLKGDGTWSNIPATPVYTGATTNANGVTGTVPAATSSQKDKFLKGDGTWIPVLEDVNGEIVQSQGVHPVINNVQYLDAMAVLSFSVYDTQYDYSFDSTEDLALGCYSGCSGFVSGTEHLIIQDDAESRIVDAYGGPNIQLTASDTVSFYGGHSEGNNYDPIRLSFYDNAQETSYWIYAPISASVSLPVGATYTVQATLVEISGVTNSSEPIADHPEVGTWAFRFVRDSTYAISSYVLWTSPNDIPAGEAIRLTATMSDSTSVTHDVMMPDVVHINGDETINGVKTFNKNTFSTPVELSGTEIDVSTSDVFVKTISADTTFTITGVPSNTVAMFSLILTNAGAYTLTFPNSVEWNDDIELKTSGIDILTFITPDGGTTWYAYGKPKGVDNYQGATSSTNGVAGLVPAATSAQKDNFLKGDGTWASVNISNMVTTDTNQTITGQKTFNSTVFGKTVALSGTQINVTNGTIFTKTITADTTFTFTGVPANAVAMFSLVLTNGGAHTITWPSNVLFADGIEPELQTSGTDLLSFITYNGGTTWINGNGTNTPAMSSSDIINTIENLS